MYCQFRGDDGDFVVSLRVLLVEETTLENDKIPNAFIFRIDPHDLQVAFFAAANRDALVERLHGRSGGNAADVALDGFHVLDGQRIVAGIADAAAAAFVFGVNPVRADGLNLVQKVLLAGETDRGDQDERRGSNHHPESR